MWTVDKTGSVLDESGKVIWFSQERFVRDIALGDCCLICGASPDQVEFNDEHVLPEWLLRRYDLFSRRIRLPNGNTVNYGSYTVPCCKTCNSRMGEEIEKPISQLVAAGRDAVRRDIYERSPLKFFVWLGLIYLKTHLKDRLLRFHLDERKGTEKIADTYDWDHLHHLHAVVRCFYTGSTISQEVIGSFMRLNVSLEPPDPVPFDYADLYLAQTMMLRLDDFAFVTVLADAGCALRHFNSKLQRLNGPLNFIQLREVMAEITAIRLHMKTPPTFRSHMDLELGHHLIYADAPDKELQEWDPEVRGRLLYNSLQSMDPVPVFVRYTEQEAMELIRAGKMTFLFDDAGNFLSANRRWGLLPAERQ